MKQNNNGQIRKKRVRIQQNIITVLCLGCIAFTAVWSVHAVKSEKKAIQTQNPSSDISMDNSSETENSSLSDSSPYVDSITESVVSSENDSVNDSSVTESTSDSSVTDLSSSENDTSSSETDSSKTDSSSDTDSSQSGTHPYAVASDTSDNLEDTAFIGDSRTVGLRNSSDKPKADFFCEVGLHVDTVLTENCFTLDNGNAGTAINALAQKKYKRVYLNFGTNELGWPYPDVFKEKYIDLINQVKSVQPDATIYAESVLPVTASRDAQGDSINNTNVKKFNEIIRQASKETGVQYLDCTKAVADSGGKLPEDASTDGVHLNQEYCLYWQNYIIDKT